MERIAAPAREKVHSVAPELAGAGAREDEPVPPPGLHEVVHDVQEFGNALDFVDDHIASGRRAMHQFAEAFRAGGQPAVQLRLQQVHDQSIRQRRGQPGGLARPARAEEEEAASRKGEESRQCRHNVGQNDDCPVILSTEILWSDAGSFSVDPIAEDEKGRAVVIENQLAGR